MFSLDRSAHSLPLRQQPLADTPGSQDFDFVSITNPDTINRILNQMHFAKSKVNIHLEEDGVSSTFESTIARVQRKDRQIIIHQLQPRGLFRGIQTNRLVQVTCYLNSGQVAFFSKLSALDDTRENHFAVLTLPDEISKFQLRSAYRVFMPPGTCKSSITLKDADGKDTLVEATGIDLSLEGSCLRFLGDVLPLLPEEKVLRELRFTLLSGKAQFSTDARICRLSSSYGGQTVAGVRFLPLPDGVRKQLQAILAEVQRLQLRQQIQLY